MNKTLAPLLRLVLVATLFAAALPASATAKGADARIAATSTLETCSWDRPGVDPFMGDVVSAVDRYQDIPADVRERLKARMARRDYDDVVSIRRDSIAGQAKARYGSAIRDMHFGSHKLCRTVSRAAWSAKTQERGLVYCDNRQCILVPTVCRNVSRITRAVVANEQAAGEFADPMIATVATIEPDLAPLLPDAPPAPFALGGDAVGEPAAESAGFGGHGGYSGGFGGFGYGGVGAPGSFASAAGAGSASGATSEKGTFGHVSSAPADVETTGAIAPVPEPETWGLMLGGLAVLTAARRRRRGAP